MIDFNDVTKVYDNGVMALKNINLHINEGEFVFVVGASGSGKSTFLKLIMKDEEPTSGSITVDGVDLSGLKRKKIPYFRRKMGIVFQDFKLINKMNVFDNVAFAMRVTGCSEKDVKKRVPHVLSLVGLEKKIKSYPAELSGGEQQRVGFARALANEPEIVIADEPTGNVDPKMSIELMELLENINKRGTTVIMVTHEHSLVKRFGNRVVEIKEGEIKKDISEGKNDKV